MEISESDLFFLGGKGHAVCGGQGSPSSLTRDGTHAACIGSKGLSPLDCEEVPLESIF